MAEPESIKDFQKINSIFEIDVVAGRNFEAISQVYSKDARILPPGAAMLTGLDHIRAFWEQAVSTMNVKALKLTTLDLQISADTAFEVGEAEMTTELPTSRHHLKYVVVWKQEDGGWKWQTDIWNAAAESKQD